MVNQNQFYTWPFMAAKAAAAKIVAKASPAAAAAAAQPQSDEEQKITISVAKRIIELAYALEHKGAEFQHEVLFLSSNRNMDWLGELHKFLLRTKDYTTKQPQPPPPQQQPLSAQRTAKSLTPSKSKTAITWENFFPLLHDAVLHAIEITQQHPDHIAERQSVFQQYLCDPKQIHQIVDVDTIVKRANDLNVFQDSLGAASIINHFQYGGCLNRLKQLKPAHVSVDDFFHQVQPTSSKATIIRHIAFFKFIMSYPILLAIKGVTFSDLAHFKKQINKHVLADLPFHQLLCTSCPRIQVHLPVQVLVESFNAECIEDEDGDDVKEAGSAAEHGSIVESLTAKMEKASIDG